MECTQQVVYTVLGDALVDVQGGSGNCAHHNTLTKIVFVAAAAAFGLLRLLLDDDPDADAS